MNIPNLPVSDMVDKNGNASDVEQIFRQNLISALQQGVGQEGFQLSSQTAANILIIFNAVDSQGTRTAQPGTLIYETDTVPAVPGPQTGSIRAIILENGVLALKTVTLT